jgi:glycopeptide antibiotics resistance protein
MSDFIETYERGKPEYVIESQEARPELESAYQRWSNRLLIAAMVGILFLTCFPFRLTSHAKLPVGASPFLLGRPFFKTSGGALDAFLNVLLFIPFGFGLSEKLSEKRKSRVAIFFAVWIAGTVLSYAIELAQLYIPGRDSGWEDVLTNGTGSAAGFFLFGLFGSALLRLFARAERAAESFFTPKRLAAALLIYFSCWFAISGRLQSETRLTNWRPDSRLLIGNDATGKAGAVWNGEVSELELWNRPLSRETAVALTEGAMPRADTPEPVAAFDLMNGPPFRDRLQSLPDLSWYAGIQGHGDSSQLVLDDGKSLVLTAPASGLVLELQRTNQFAIHVVCKPAEAQWFSPIISISRTPAMANLTMQQEATSLVFWFRSPVSTKHAQLAWDVSNVFAPNQVRNIVYSYDGSILSLYMDGKLAALPYRLGPGAALARTLRRIRPSELDGYHDIYYALVFFPAGVALGIAARAAWADGLALWLSFGLGLVAPAILFELLLVAVSGREFSAGSLVLSAVLSALGALWINADRITRGRAPAT